MYFDTWGMIFILAGNPFHNTGTKSSSIGLSSHVGADMAVFQIGAFYKVYHI